MAQHGVKWQSLVKETRKGCHRYAEGQGITPWPSLFVLAAGVEPALS